MAGLHNKHGERFAAAQVIVIHSTRAHSCNAIGSACGLGGLNPRPATMDTPSGAFWGGGLWIAGQFHAAMMAASSAPVGRARSKTEADRFVPGSQIDCGPRVTIQNVLIFGCSGWLVGVHPLGLTY